MAHPDRAPGGIAGIRIKMVLAVAMLGFYSLIAGFVVVNIHHRLDPSGAPLFYDFSAFYQAARFADEGRPSAAYDDPVMIAAEQAAFPGLRSRLPWNYPPTFQLLLAPLGQLPYGAAWMMWTVGLCVAFAAVAKQLVRADRLPLVLLAPAAAINVLLGQNGLLSTALIGGGTLLLGRRPILGGALLGLMVYKPHFAVLAPLALIAGREWRALAGAILSGAALILASAAAFGVGPWIAFLHKAAQPAALFTSSSSAWRSIPSVMIMARSLGFDPRVSSGLHWLVAGLAAAGALWVWRSTHDARIRAGALAAATLLVTPYLRVYDLALLILPIAALAQRAEGEVGLAEQVAIAAAWLVPAVLLAVSPAIQFGPLLAIALLGLIVRRTLEANPKRRTAAVAGAGPASPPG